ncbi:MAG: hypothetical protein HRU71_12055 [Planctomycetia bacterium]|nr:MAG: hypothetical protein HRU71_12055 [Planctomycetia bacterium]
MAATVDELIHDPIGWAQVRLAGGWKRLMMATGGYALVSLVVHVLIYRLIREEVTLPRFADAALNVNLMIAAAFIFFVGTGAIKKAIQRDFTSEMISSHRRTSMSGATACMGYLTGPLAQAMMVTFVNWLICTLLARMGTTPLGQSPVGMIGLFAVMLVMGLSWWTFALLTGLCTRGKVSVAPLIVCVFIATNAKFIYIVPGLAMLFGSSIATDLIDQSSLATIAWWLMFSVFAQLGFALIFFVASARKYHHDDLAAFDPLLAMALAALSGLVGGVGLRFWQPRTTFFLPNEIFNEPSNWMFLTTLLLTFVLMVPVASAAFHHAVWSRRQALDPLFREKRPLNYWAGALLACILGFGVLTAVAGRDWSRLLETENWQIVEARLCAALAASFLTLLTLGGVLRFVYAASPKALWAIVLFVIATWAIPPFADASLDAMRELDLDGPRSILFTASPVGTWLWAFKNFDAPVWSGLIVQGVLALGAMVLASRAKYAGRVMKNSE